MTDQDKPSIDFNLDTLDREARPEPFSFVLSGTRYVVQDPSELDWRVMANLQTAAPAHTIRELLGNEQYERFAAVKHVPDWKVGKLLIAIGEHYGVGTVGEDDGSSGS